MQSQAGVLNLEFSARPDNLLAVTALAGVPVIEYGLAAIATEVGAFFGSLGWASVLAGATP